MKKIFKGFATVAVIASAISGQVLAETFTFGIVPQQSATKLAKVWGPVLKHLEAETGVEFQFATATDIPTFEKRLMDGVYDFAYMNPYHFTFFNEHKGYQALAHRADKKIQGLLVTRKDSVITELSQLKGKEVAFPSPAAFAASLVPRGELAKMGINITPRYVSSHDSVYLGVSREFSWQEAVLDELLTTLGMRLRKSSMYYGKQQSILPMHLLTTQESILKFLKR